MSTTSLYNTTQQTGTVSSANSTSLYSNTTDFTTGVVNSSVYSVNGGLGVTVNPVTGNVVVSIGQDVATTANVTFANITATGSLSNAYYTLANAVGTNGQVLTTNGAGTTTWTTPSSLGLVSSVTGSGAGISVSPTTGAVIVSNTGVTSIVAGSNISISGGTGAVTITATGFGTGDVTGPASATDNAIVRFDGTTGKLIQNSTVTIADTTGNITTNGDIAVNGGDITTTQTTASLFNTTATIVNIGNGADNELNLGSPTGGSEVIIKPATILGISATQAVFDTIATTVNAFGAATAVNIGAATGTTTIEHDLTVNGGNINLNGAATAGVMPFLTFADQASGANSMYGIRGKSTSNDPWFVGAGSTGVDGGYLEIATGDNAGDPADNASPIYARQYNGYAGTGAPWYGGNGVVVNEFVLLDESGDTSIPNNLTVGGDLTVTGTNINTGATDTIIQIDKVSSDTAVSNRALKLLSTSTGTPTVGFGTALGFQGQTGVSTVKDAAYIAIASTDITPGSEDFSMNFGLMQNGTTFSNKMELNSSGDLIIDGQFDATRIDIDGQATIDTATLTTTSTATVALTTTATRNAMSGLINIIQGTNVHCLNFTALRVDATTALLTTYGEMYNNISLGSFTADVNAGSLRLLVTPSSATSTVFSAVRTSLT
jgi:hypothetical protein